LPGAIQEKIRQDRPSTRFPDSYRGEAYEKAKVTLCEYDESHFQEREISTLEGTLPPPTAAAVTWIHIDGLHEYSSPRTDGGIFRLHPLTLEDILNTEQRPKSEDHGDYLYIVLRLFHEGADGALIPSRSASSWATTGLISLQEKEGKLIALSGRGSATKKGALRKAGADYLAHALLDTIVDSYFVHPGQIRARRLKIWKMRWSADLSPNTARHPGLQAGDNPPSESVWPLREMLGSLGGRLAPHPRAVGHLLPRRLRPRRPGDRHDRDYRDMLSGMLDIYLSSISNRMKRDHESPHHHRDNLHAADLSRRGLRDEFSSTCRSWNGVGDTSPLGVMIIIAIFMLDVFSDEKMALAANAVPPREGHSAAGIL